MRNAGLEEAQAGIKIAGRNINHLRYAGDTTLTAESEEELKSLLMKVNQILKDDAIKELHSICQQLWKSQQWPQDLKRSVFIPIPKNDNAKECSNNCTIVLISQARKVMLKILQAGLQQYVNREISDVQAGFSQASRGHSTLTHGSQCCILLHIINSRTGNHVLWGTDTNTEKK